MNSLHNRIISKLILLCVIAILASCASPPSLKIKNNYSESDLFNDALFGQPIDIISLDDVFALTEDQKQDFLNKFHSKDYRDLTDSERIFKYLNNHLDNFNFHSETLVATDALALSAGNCMSLAILTKALSQLTHAGIQYELARTPPIFQREGNLELSSQHIRTVVFNKNTSSTKQFVRPNNKIKIDYFSTAGSRTLRKVKKDEFYSLFYSNRAAEAMIRGEYDRTYWNIKEALKIKYDDLVAINILGVLYQNMNQNVFAERAYRYGLSFGHDQLELLNNYHNFLVTEKRHSEAEIIAQELTNYNDPDPFKWLDLADQEFKKGNYRKSIKLYEKASEKADYLHQPYAGIAKANYLLGRPNQAIASMELALDNAHTKKTTSIYQAKYEYLKSHIKNPEIKPN
jgi:hypothetical protein